jgi:hypothetical protein
MYNGHALFFVVFDILPALGYENHHHHHHHVQEGLGMFPVP